MPSKKRKYNARFPAGRIKKIMQTDEEVGKVAQAVPIIISRTLELFVQSLLSKAMQVTTARNAKTLSPSHVKHCIHGEARFDFLKDLVKNIPDVSAAEEKEMMSAENSPNSSRFSDMSMQPRRALEDSNSSSSSDIRIQHQHNRSRSSETEVKHKDPDRPELLRSKSDLASDLMKQPHLTDVIDLSKKEDFKPVAANFYQETLVDHSSVIKLNPTYSPQPSTSYNEFSYGNLKTLREDIPKPFSIDLRRNTSEALQTPSTPILNIDFTKSLAKPEIKVLDSNVIVQKDFKRQNSKIEVKKYPIIDTAQIDLDNINSGNLQIDEDYDT